MFTYKTRIFLHHTDAAGRLFFASQFYLMHEAKESFFESIGVSIASMLSHPRITFPIVHAEADYKAILQAGDRITVNIEIEKIGETSVVFVYTILKENGQVVGTGKTVSVAVDLKTQQKVPLPADWRAKFEPHLKS